MKAISFIFSVMLTTGVFAKNNCKITGTIYDGFNCTGLSVKVEAHDDLHCKELSEMTISNNFFDQLGRRDRILAVRYKFKEGKLRAKGKIYFEDVAKLCLPIGPIYGM